MNRKASIAAAVLLAPVLLLGAGVRPHPHGRRQRGDLGGGTDGAGHRGARLRCRPQRLHRRPPAPPRTTSRGRRPPGPHWVSPTSRRRAGRADPSYYDKADEALARSLELEPEANADALAGQAALANARHDFADGRDLALAAVEADAYDSTARGVLADAQLELGDFDGSARHPRRHARPRARASRRSRGSPTPTSCAVTSTTPATPWSAPSTSPRTQATRRTCSSSSATSRWTQGELRRRRRALRRRPAARPGPGGAAGLAGAVARPRRDAPTRPSRPTPTSSSGCRSRATWSSTASCSTASAATDEAAEQYDGRRRGGSAVPGAGVGAGRRDGALPGRSRSAGARRSRRPRRSTTPAQPAGARRDGVGAARERSRRRGARARRAGRGRGVRERDLGVPPRHDPARARGRREPPARRWSRPSRPTRPSRPCTRRSPRAALDGLATG